MEGWLIMDCPLRYHCVITRGNLIIKYFSKMTNSSCSWYRLEDQGAVYEILISVDKEEILAVYKDEALIYLNKNLLRSPMVLNG